MKGKEKHTHNKRRREITIETHEITVIRKSSVSFDDRCSTCAGGAPSFPLEVVASLLSVSLAEVIGMMESGAIHGTGTRSRVLRICGRSITGSLENSAKD